MEKIATHQYNNKNSKSQYEENLEFKILVAKEEMLVVENTVWYFIDKENLLQFFSADMNFLATKWQLMLVHDCASHNVEL